MFKIISVLGSVVFLGIYLIWNQQAWTSQVEDLKFENQKLLEEIEILKVTFREFFRAQRTSPDRRAEWSLLVMETSFCCFDVYLFRKKNLALKERKRNWRLKHEDCLKKHRWRTNNWMNFEMKAMLIVERYDFLLSSAWRISWRFGRHNWYLRKKKWSLKWAAKILNWQKKKRKLKGEFIWPSMTWV